MRSRWLIFMYSVTLCTLPDTLLEYAYRKLVFLYQNKSPTELNKLPLPSDLRNELSERIWFLKSMQQQYVHKDNLLYSILSMPKITQRQQRLLEYMIAYESPVLQAPAFRVRPVLMMVFLGYSSKSDLFLRLYHSPASNLYATCVEKNILEYAIYYQDTELVKKLLADRRFNIHDPRAHHQLAIKAAQTYKSDILYQLLINQKERS